MWAFTMPGMTTLPRASITLSKGPVIAPTGAMRAMRPPSNSSACPSSTRQGAPKVIRMPFSMRMREVMDHLLFSPPRHLVPWW